MAAGTSSRFVPLSWECPKGLLDVKGEILIERQIRQLREAGVEDISVVVGYMAEKFAYLKEKFGVDIVYNEDYARFNNTSSLIRVIDRLANTFICSSDNYFPENVFIEESSQSYYSALYASGKTNEYCLDINEKDEITGVRIGGENSWYMIGHVFFSQYFSEIFRKIFRREYENVQTRLGYWEDLYIRYIERLPKMKVNRYQEGEITEFDSLDELRTFDKSYLTDTRSDVIKNIAQTLGCTEAALSDFKKIGEDNFSFKSGKNSFKYNRHSQGIERQ